MKWVLADCDEAAAVALAERSGLPLLVARLLVNRGIIDHAAARAFLECDLSQLSPPGIFSGILPAVNRIKQSVSAREKIVVYGDYDVDGVTGASLLYLVLKEIGGDVACYIPDRMSEGYGVNEGALEKISASGAKLVITVDCGIGSFREAETARRLGLDLIITDHHEMNGSGSSNGLNGSNSLNETSLPDACAILHPRLLLPDVPDGNREQVSGLTGVGVAFKLAQALFGADGCDERLQGYLDLVALGTIADVGRITGENRVLLKHGLDRLSRDDRSQRPGLAALKKIAGLNGKKITAGIVGFTLAPRINASGRLDRADAAFRLLTTNSSEEAESLASSLDAVNRERQAVEEQIKDEARELCLKRDLKTTGAFVLSSPEWHPGVIGIVASRIVEEFYRPSALITIKDGIGKGSARSIPGFDLYKGLSACENLLLRYGGHKYAAGFAIEADRIPEFGEKLSALVMESVGQDGFIRTQTVDAAVNLEELSIELIRQLEKLSPFGQGNPEPRLGVRGLQVISSRIVGNNHLKMRMKGQGGISLDAIAFNKGGLLGQQVRDGATLAAVFTPRINSWNGSAAVELEIRDLKTEKT
jgi:single-stranded-DNA-specific exonuclease